jgi:hypothetical protein
MNPRTKELTLALICAVTANVIGWPGPHGGLQFVGHVLWSAELRCPPSVQALVVVPLGLLILASLLPRRGFRVGSAITASVWLAGLFLLLFKRIYPPVWPIVLVTSIPFLASLGGSVWFSFRQDGKSGSCLAGWGQDASREPPPQGRDVPG